MEEFEGHPLVDVDAERAVLGEILLEPELFSMARSVLTDDDFHHPCHRAVWEAMVVAENERRVVEFRGVVDVLRTSGKLNAVGGTQFVADLSDAAPTTAHFDLHLAIVADAGAGRRTEAKLRLALAELRRPGHPGVRAAMSAAFAHVADIEMTRPDRAARHIGDVADRAFQQLEALDAGISKTPRTGFLALDGDAALGIPGMVGGFASGALWVLTADTKGGKTALATQWLQTVAEQGFPALMFEQEMEDTELFWRMACGAQNLPVTRTRQGLLSAHEMGGLIGESSRLSRLPLWIEASGMADVHFIRAMVQEQKRRHGLRFAVVDYLQILAATPNLAKVNQAEALGYMTRHLKQTARLCGVTIVLLSQVSREAAQGKVRELHGLKGSSAIAQDADLVAVIRRDKDDGDDGDNGDDDDDKRRVTSTWQGVLDVVANRHGPSGKIPVRFDGQRMRFEEIRGPQEIEPEARATMDERRGEFGEN